MKQTVEVKLSIEVDAKDIHINHALIGVADEAIRYYLRNSKIDGTVKNGNAKVIA